MPTIHAPSDFTGTTHIGPLILKFRDGVAEHDGELPEGIVQYLAAAGYGIDEDASDAEDEPEPLDPRDIETEVVGAPLRDAAVDPSEVDFLPPVNAGLANPHGPAVVAPGIHAANMPKPIHPGPVGHSGNLDTPDRDEDPNVVKDTDVQAENEMRLAEAVLVEQQPVPAATLDAAKVDPVGEDARAAIAREFDPADHTVPEVNEHLADADDAERARVLAAESDGKSRTGVLSGPHAGDYEPEHSAD